MNATVAAAAAVNKNRLRKIQKMLHKLQKQERTIARLEARSEAPPHACRKILKRNREGDSGKDKDN